MGNLALKMLFIIPIIFFVDYMAMIMVGCISCLLGFTCSFSSIGLTIMMISLVIFILALLPDIKALFKKHSIS